MNYIKEKNDCDNFSFILYGNFLEYTYKYNISYSYLFGVIYAHNFNSNLNHLINFFVDDQYTVYCIEPQNDKIDICENFGYEFYRAIIFIFKILLFTYFIFFIEKYFIWIILIF